MIFCSLLDSRSSGPRCSSVGGFHQSKRLRHSQLVSIAYIPPASSFTLTAARFGYHHLIPVSCLICVWMGQGLTALLVVVVIADSHFPLLISSRSLFLACIFHRMPLQQMSVNSAKEVPICLIAKCRNPQSLFTFCINKSVFFYPCNLDIHFFLSHASGELKPFSFYALRNAQHQHLSCLFNGHKPFPSVPFTRGIIKILLKVH